MDCKLIAQPLYLIALLAIATISYGANPSGVSLEVIPKQAKNGDTVTVKVNITGGSEGISFTTKNLTKLRGYHDHCGFCDEPNHTRIPCMVGNEIQSCSSLCYNGQWDGIGCEYSFRNEFSSSWFGGPTIEYEVNGCDTAEVTAIYYGSSHEGPFTLKTEEIIIEDGIVADFATSSPVCEGEEVQFENLSCGGDTYSWSFGDGTTSTEESPAHTFEDTGTYSVTLTVSSDYDSDTKTEQIKVRDGCALITGMVFESGLGGTGMSDVQLSAGGSGISVTSESSASGSYRMAVEPFKPYSMFAAKSGYKEVVGPTVTLATDEVYVWNPAMTPLDPSEVEKDSILGDQPNNVEEPVNPATGNYYTSKHLFIFAGRKKMGVDFSAHYNSLENAVDGPLGFGWTHSYNIHLTEQNDVAVVRFGDGHKEYFTWNPTQETYTAIGSHPSIRLFRSDPDGWQADLGGGWFYHFDGQGRLYQIADLDGNAITLTYSAHLDRITDTQGRVIDFFYDSNRLSHIISPLVGGGGHTAEFEYDLSGNLTSITDGRGNSWQYSYDAEHRLLTEIDRRGNLVLTNTYDTEGRIASQKDAENGVSSFQYNENELGLLVQITTPGQQSYSHQYDKGYNLIEVTDGIGLKARFKVGPNGQPLNAMDKQNRSMYFESNELGLVTRIVNRLGVSLDIAYNQYQQITSVTDQFGRQRSFSYNENGNLTSEEDRNNNYIKYQVNSRGQTDYVGHTAYGGTWDIDYNGNGQVTTVTDKNDNTTTYHYDASGRPIQRDNPTGLGSTTFGYDANNNLLWRQTPLGYRIEYTYNENNQLLTRTFVPTGAQTIYIYDAMGRLQTITDPLGGVRRYGYNAVGSMTTEEDQDGVITTFGYDNRNLLTSIENESGNTLRFGYDANGNQIRFTNQLGDTVHRTFDAEGWPLSKTDALGNTTTYQRNKSITEAAITDPLGLKTSFLLDDEGYLGLIRRPDGSFVQYNRNSAGMIVSAVDEQGNRWRYAYDALGRLQEMTDPAGNSETYQYDAVGNVSSITRRDGTVLSWTYDLDRRLSSLSLPGGESITWSYSYDGVNGTKTVQMVETAGTTTSVFNNLDRLVSRTDLHGNTMQYEYTAAGRLSKVIYPGSNEVSYIYDDYGRLDHVDDWLGNTTSYLYDSLDRVIEMVLPNNTRTLYEYDALNLLKTIQYLAGDGSTMASIHYRRDKLGRIVDETRSGEPNITSGVGETEITIDPSNRIETSSAGGESTSYSFDDNGNLTGKETGAILTTYSYDTFNRLKEVSGDGQSTTYRYDHAGNRIAKTYNGVEVRYQREAGHVYTLLDSANVPIDFHVYTDRLLYANTAAGETVVYHSDIRGSIICVTDGSGSIVATKAYSSYGKTIGSTGSFSSPFGYVGAFGVLSDENGLLHMRARFYDPQIGRFLTEDPLGIAAGLNVYSYVEGDPANHIDPQGLAGDLPLNIPECPVESQATDIDVYQDNSPYYQQKRKELTGKQEPMGDPTLLLPGDIKKLKRAFDSSVNLVNNPSLESAGDFVLESSMAGVQVIDRVATVAFPPAKVVTSPVRMGTDVVYNVSTKLVAPQNAKLYAHEFMDNEEIANLHGKQFIRDWCKEHGIDYADYVKWEQQYKELIRQ